MEIFGFCIRRTKTLGSRRPHHSGQTKRTRDQTLQAHRNADHRKHESGASVADLCRKHGISDATVYKWKAKYGGMDVSEAKRLKGLEDENARLKRLLADAMLDNAALKDLLGKKW